MIQTPEAAPPPSAAPQSESVLGPLAQIPPGEGRDFLVAGRSVAVFHLRGGAVYATQSACPHRQGPLADGLLGGTTIVCPFHAWKFDLKTGTPLLGTCGITTYPVRLTETGDLVLTLTNEPQQPAEGGECPSPGFNLFSKGEAGGRSLPATGS